MARPEKIEFVNQLSDKLKKTQSVVLADFKGLTVHQMTDLRTQLRSKEVDLKVIKNRLGRRALAEAGCDAMDDYLCGNTAWAFGIKDAVDPAKVMDAFAKANEKLVIKGGLLERRRIDPAKVRQLADLPSRPVLLGRMAGCLKQPATKVATAMEASITKVARAFAALAEKLEKQSGGVAAS